MKTNVYWRNRAQVKRLLGLIKRIDRNKKDFALAWNSYLSRPIVGLPRRINHQSMSQLRQQGWDELQPLWKPLCHGQVEGVLQNLRHIATRMISRNTSLTVFISFDLALREVVLPKLLHDLPVSRQVQALEIAARFLQSAWMEIIQGSDELYERIIKEKTSESSVLFHTTQSMTTELDMEALLRKVVFHAGMLLRGRHVYLFMVEPVGAMNPSERRLVLRASNPLGQAYGEYSLRFGEGPVGRVAERLTVVVDNQYGKSSKKIPFLNKTQHIMVAPITFSEELLGVLLATSDEMAPKRFTASEKELFVMYTRQIALSFKNVLLYQAQQQAVGELEEKNRMLESQSELILRQSAHMVVLNEVAQKVNSSIELSEVLGLLAHQSAESIGVDRCIVWLFDDKKTFLTAATAHGMPLKKLANMSFHLGDIRETFLMQLFSEQRALPVYSESSRSIIRKLMGDEIIVNAALVVPLVLKEETIGMLMVDDTREAHDFLDDEIVLISSITNQTVMAIENARLYLKVKEQAITDGLTGLYNHRFFQLRFTDEFAHSKRYGNDLAVIMLDIDHFKDYNDTYGHVAGDLALKEIASLAKASVRENDIVARYGGEEFVVILPMTNIAGAKIVAERIRQGVCECKFLGDVKSPQVSMSISAGISAFSSHMANRETLLKQADAALYTAKQAGRNRTHIYGGTPAA